MQENFNSISIASFTIFERSNANDLEDLMKSALFLQRIDAVAQSAYQRVNVFFSVHI